MEEKKMTAEEKLDLTMEEKIDAICDALDGNGDSRTKFMDLAVYIAAKKIGIGSYISAEDLYNFTAPHEREVTISLAEYRKLVETSEKANSFRVEANNLRLEVNNLKAELEALK